MIVLEAYLFGVGTGPAGVVVAFAVATVRKLERKADK